MIDPSAAPDAAAYGLRFRGLGDVPGLETAAADFPAEPAVAVVQSTGTAPPPTPEQRVPGRSVRVLPDGRTLELVSRAGPGGAIGGAATLYGAPLPLPDLAHPYLTPVAVPFARWNGWEAFHGGVFATGSRAWVVRGARTAGKSSLLAGLAGQGVPVLADDMAVTDGSAVHAGPRSIDLREPVPGVDLAQSDVRRGTRRRLLLPPVPRSLPLGGWLFLQWGEDIALRPVPPTAVLARLAVRRAHAHWPSDPSLLLALALRPAFDLVRPRRWDAVPAVIDALLAQC